MNFRKKRGPTAEQAFLMRNPEATVYVATKAERAALLAWCRAHNLAIPDDQVVVL